MTQSSGDFPKLDPALLDSPEVILAKQIRAASLTEQALAHIADSLLQDSETVISPDKKKRLKAIQGQLAKVTAMSTFLAQDIAEVLGCTAEDLQQAGTEIGAPMVLAPVADLIPLPSREHVEPLLGLSTRFVTQKHVPVVKRPINRELMRAQIIDDYAFTLGGELVGFRKSDLCALNTLLISCDQKPQTAKQLRALSLDQDVSGAAFLKALHLTSERLEKIAGEPIIIRHVEEGQTTFSLSPAFVIEDQRKNIES